MIDFYLINDDQTKPNSPRQGGLRLAGGLDDEIFEHLKQKGVIESRFDPYSSFRWGTSVVKNINQTIIQRQLSTDNDVKNLLTILQLADENQCGLIAYGD